MDKLSGIVYCEVCGNYFSIKENTLQIKNVPEFTFNFSNKTVDLNIGECKFCGAIQLFDVPLSDNYNEVYRSIGVSLKYRNEKKEYLNKVIEKYNLKNTKILEIGCGNGQILEIFREIGINCYGIEYGENNRIECLEKEFIVNNCLGRFENSFNCVYSSYFLEHFPNPKKFCNILFNSLNLNGIGIVEVPNYDIIEKNNLWLEFSKDHRFYYRKQTLIYLFTICGFIIEEINEINEGLGYSVIVRKPFYPNSAFKNIEDTIKKEIDKFNNLIKNLNGNYAVYGASHYIMLLLNYVDILPRYIFDGNEKKVGKKIKEIDILYKDEIKNKSDCNNIIICCGGYNKEIYRMLEEMNLNKNLIIWE